MNGRTTHDKRNSVYTVAAALAGLFFTVLTASAVLLTEGVYRYLAAAAGVLLCAAAELAIFILRQREAKSPAAMASAPDFDNMLADVFRRLDSPVAVTTVDGKIIWGNDALVALCGAAGTGGKLTGSDLSSVTGRDASETISGSSNGPVVIGERFFNCTPYLMQSGERDAWLTVFTECTDLIEAGRKIDREAPVVGYAVLDNLEELAQYVKVSAREATNMTEKVLREWVAGIDGFMIEYSRDKYFFAFPRVRLAECVDSSFDILSKVRQIGLGDSSMSVTLSMGLSVCGATIRERERDAAAALETALQKGGDQAVLRTGEQTLQFGGRTKTDLNRTKIKSRVTANTLIPMLIGARNVLLMGHRNPDFDCIGACIGLSKLSRAYNQDVKIISDLNNANFRVCTAALIAEQPEYSDIFIDREAARDMIYSDTLLIIADVNNLKIVEAPEIVNSIQNYIIIDHHRKTAEFEREPALTYIEPGTSSCCELVAEMLETVSVGVSVLDDSARLTKHEATVMLSGMMLDTRNFTRSTNGETFAAAVYLRELGASSETAGSFFYNDFSGFVTETKLESSVRIYRGRVAMTVSDIDGGSEITAEDRISLARAADTLLTVRDVDAAIAMLVCGGTVVVSARSNGSINVQQILEKIGGGGHFDAAGAQIEDTTVRDVIQQLKQAVDEYLDGGN